MPYQSIPPSQACPPLFVGVDVGGTNTKIGVVDDQGRTAAYVRIETEQEHGPADAVGRIAEAVQGLLRSGDWSVGKQAVALGLGTPGTMDIPAGMILEPPNMPAWRHFPIRDELAKAVGLPVFFCNDAAAAAYGEFWIGSGQEHQSIVLLTLGTGVGGGIIIDDISIDGSHSHGGECGHIIIDSSPHARLCSCGQRGHLEAYASATAVMKRTQELLRELGSTLLLAPHDNGEEVTPLMVAQAAEAGDPLAERIVMETADYLAIGLATLIHVIDPEAVLLGGAMTFGGEDSALGRRFLDRVEEQTRCRIFPVLAERTEIRFAQLGGNAGYVGAAGMARHDYARRRP